MSSEPNADFNPTSADAANTPEAQVPPTTPDTPTTAGPQITIRFISVEGAGLAESVTIPAGTTIGEFAKKRVAAGRSIGDYRFTIDRREPTSESEVLTNGVRVVMTARKIDGAA